MTSKLVSVYCILVLTGNLIRQCYADPGDYVTVFDVGHQGAKLNVSIAQCTNLSYYWKFRVSAIATHGLCARLFSGPDCTGNSIEIMPTSPAHHDLLSWNFNDKAMSLGPCRPDCSTEVTGDLPNTTFQIKIFNQANYQGLNRNIDVQGCAVIPVIYLRKTGSVNSYGHCVQLYSNPTRNPHLGRNVELRRDTPYHNDLSQWEMIQAKSVSHCAHKCTNNSGVGLEDGDVVLFDEHSLKGNFVKRNVREGNCLNINADWEAAAWSVQVSNNTCVTLFDQRNCLGEFLNVNKSIWNLKFVQFQQKTRSMKSCGSYEVSTTKRVTRDRITINIASNNRRPDRDEYKQATFGDSMSPLVIFVVVLLVFITGTIVVIKISPSARNNIYSYYGTLRSRLFEEDANEEFFSGFRWEADEPPCEQERNITRSEITAPTESQLDFDFLRESMGSGTCEAVYEELVYKNTVASIGK